MSRPSKELNFHTDRILPLFRKILYPTIGGMLFTALFIVTDGVFVGRGIGSYGLATVNIVSPIFLFSSGVGLMLGMGTSVVTSICLSHGKYKLANCNTSQTMVIETIIVSFVAGLLMIFPYTSLRIFGSSDALRSLAYDYLMGSAPFMVFNAALNTMGFMVRLSGAPRYAMTCSVVAASINILLDYLFIFVFKFGILGAAIATGIGTVVGVFMLLGYLFNVKNRIHFIPLTLSLKGLRFMYRNIKISMTLGFPSFVTQMTVACLLLCGNYTFMYYIGENGVAAFSIICYIFPLMFMLYNAISQSSQPIISFNYGIKNAQRIRKMLYIVMRTGLLFGIGVVVLLILLDKPLVGLFIIDKSNPAYLIGIQGIPYIAIAFLPFALNVIAIGYFQSVAQTRRALYITIMRGFVFMIISFILLPMFLGNKGIWLSLPVSEIATFVLVVYLFRRHVDLFPVVSVAENDK